MSRYETDQEQMDVLKKWWKENGTSLLIGLLVITLGWSAWTYYKTTQTNKALQGSAVFEAMQVKMQEGQFGDVAREGLKLMEEQPESPYSTAAALMLAKFEWEKGEKAKAEEHLKWVLTNSDDASLKFVATLRLASVYINQGELDKAQSTLDGVKVEQHVPSEQANYQFQVGELALAQQNLEKARTAFKAVVDNEKASANIQNLAKIHMSDLALPK